MLKSLLSGESDLWLADEFLDQVFALLGHFFPLIAFHSEHSLSDSAQNLLVAVSVERRIAAKQNVEDATS